MFLPTAETYTPHATDEILFENEDFVVYWHPANGLVTITEAEDGFLLSDSRRMYPNKADALAYVRKTLKV